MRRTILTFIFLLHCMAACQLQELPMPGASHLLATTSPEVIPPTPYMPTLGATVSTSYTATVTGCQTGVPPVNLANLPKIPVDKLPTPRYYATMAYDQSRQVIVLFGGAYDADTWEYNGFSWKQIMTDSIPPGRSNPALTYDQRRQVVLMFGGWGGNPGLDILWEYNGEDWREVQQENAPEQLRFPVLTYYPLWEKVILFGEYRNDTATYQTWTYDGTTWENLNQDLPAIPMPSMPFQSAYDSCHQRLYLQMLSDWTYEFNGSWQILLQCESFCSQLPLWTSTLVYDSRRDKLINFGSKNIEGAWQSETWEFDGKVWQQVYPLISPSPRSGHAMVFDEARGVTVLFGGATEDGIPLNDTWEYDGVTWVER